VCRNREDDVNLGYAAPVGAFPLGVWAGGPCDIAGNVWEWTQTRFLGYDTIHDQRRERPGGVRQRVIRGSSWYDDKPQQNARCSARYPDFPGHIYFDLGFRFVAAQSAVTYQRLAHVGLK